MSKYFNEQYIIKHINELINKLLSHKSTYTTLFDTFSSFILDCFTVFSNEISNNKQQPIDAHKQTEINMMSGILSLTAIFIKNCQD